MVLGILTGLLRISSKYTKHGNFTSKRGNKNFYKGRGGKKYGRLNSKGKFIATSMPNWFMPDLTGFRLKPYVMPGEGLIRRNTVSLRVTSKIANDLSYGCAVRVLVAAREGRERATVGNKDNSRTLSRAAVRTPKTLSC